MSNQEAIRGLNSFKDIPDQMIFKGAALRQIDKFREVAEALGFPWEVVGHHTSKSLRLPVICLHPPGMKVYLRDNFHDINICVEAEAPLTIPLASLFEGILQPQTWDWYLEEVARCRDYSWREWTDEQMDTPGLLALSNDVPSYLVKSLETKARWSRRLIDPAWFRHDWSSGTITWEGEFGPEAALWVQPRPYMQGIPSSVTNPYKPECLGFALALDNCDQAVNLVKRLCP